MTNPIASKRRSRFLLAGTQVRMSKAATIDALVESAIHHFAKCGYEGASLRDIARNADVPLSTIHLYFGSKWDLFHAATHRAWMEIDQERHALLEKTLAASGDSPAPLEGLVYALAYPTVRRGLSKDAREHAQVFMMHTLWRHFLDTSMMGVADKSMSSWIDAMARACPDLTRQDVIWAFSYVVGVVYSWQVIGHRYDSMLGPYNDPAPEDVTADITAFCAKGILAIVERRGRPTA